MRVLLTWRANEQELSLVRDSLSQEVEIAAPGPGPGFSRFEIDYRDLPAHAGGYDAVMGWAIPWRLFENKPVPRALIWLHAGCDALNFELLKRHKIAVANVAGANAVSVAEHAMMLLLASARGLVSKHRAVEAGDWSHYWTEGASDRLAIGSTLTLVGFGRVGEEVARRARAFGMRIVAVRRHVEKGGDVDKLYAPHELKDALGEADFVILAAPLTEETQFMIGAEEIGVMQPSAFLINVARAMLVDELALYNALIEERLAGYASDVWWNYTEGIPPSTHYPVPSRSGLHKLARVIATGDKAICPIDVKDQMISWGAESLDALLRGEPMPRSVDLQLGY